KGFAGAATLTVAPSILHGALQSDETKKPKIITRKLGRTGLELPVVSMGVMNADNPNLVKAALEKGIVHLDTAHGYQRGRNEEMLGKTLKDVSRDRFIISTKIPGNKFNKKSGEWEKAMDADDFLEKFELSLKRLQMDYVDIFYLHSRKGREETLEAEILEAMVKLKKEGKARFLGVSTHRNQPEVIQAAIDADIYDVVLTSYNFRQKNYKEVSDAIEKASKAGLGVVAMKTQAGVFWEEKKNKINMKAALKWVLQNPNVHTTIPGFSTFDQMNEDLEVMEDIVLTSQEIKDLKLGEEMGMVGLYCNQCGVCDEQCLHNLDVPTLMRSYMYAFGYNNLLHAKDTFKESNITELACDKCDVCNVDCVAGFDVKAKLTRIYDIQNVPDTFLV
ncbi:MAG: oxidoreductase, partial [Chlorobi bacterium]|nr:oxidoreductase [Chlorobiota bacterium]